MPHGMAAAAEGDWDGDAPIAAFAVSKGGVVLKHIFLNAPPPGTTTRGGENGGGKEGGDEEEEDPPVMVGRHPDCHVLVDHPSVSRFHLQLRCRRRQRRITVTDLCSVHGTWVSGRRIPPSTPVDLATGDTLRLGASKREYRLLWLSLREALEMDDPLHMPPLPEEEKEQPLAYEEANSQLETGQESVDMDTHQETSQQIVSENNALPAKVAPSAPPLPEFSHSTFSDEPSVSKFHEETDRVTEETLVNKNSISESFGSLIIQEMPATLTNPGKPVQSDKRGATNQMSKRSKLKSVKSLHIDTGRSMDRSSALSYSLPIVDQNDVLVCSQSCGTECAACVALFGIPEFERAEEKEEVIAEDKVHLSPPASITMEGNKKESNPDNYISQDFVDAKLQKILGLADSSPPLHFKYDAFADKEIPQWNADTVNYESEPLSENVIMPEIKSGGLIQINLEGSLSDNENMSSNKIAEGPKNCQLEGTLDAEGIEENKEICPLDKENITPNVSGNILLERSHRGLKPTFSQELMDSISPLNLDHGNFSENENPMLNMRNQIKSSELVSGNLNLPISHLELKDDILPDRENSVLAPGDYEAFSSPVRLEDLFSDKENVTPASKVKPNMRRVLGSRMDNSVSAKNTSNKEKFHTVDSDVFYSDKENLTPMSSGGMKVRKCLPKDLTSDLDQGQEEFCSDKENSVLAPGEYEAFSSPVRLEDLFSDKENLTPASKVKPNMRRVLGSRMGNSVSAKNTSNKEKFHAVDSNVFYSDKENLTPMSSGGMKARKCLPKNLTAELDQGPEAFCSDKENLTPLSSAARRTWDMSENRARVESAITKKRVADRVPFQTLLSNSPLRPTSSLDHSCAVARPADIAAGDLAIKLEDKLNNLACNNQESGRTGQGVKAWTMVANTDSLLDDESRKAIVLLKGIKGTHLFIPRIVIRELDSMKQREGLFRRSTKATSILQWIEECMAAESWWIHVQSSSEMFPIAATPPATPSAQSIDEEIKIGSGASFNPMAFFSPGSFALADIMSPKPEDRVLDSALLLTKLRSDHSIVLLSNSVTLKIKAMAEGMVCDGAKEFRESLMNPCSSRFMWAASAPRGSAWSCLDAAALAENYYNSHHHAMKRAVPARPAEAAAKGLKLILRYNSLYAQATDAVRRTPPLATLASV